MRFILTCIWLFSAVSGRAQGDSVRYYYGLPVTGEDSVIETETPDRPPYRRITTVPVDELPGELVKALDERPIYEGWRDTIVYFDQNSKLYVVPIPYDQGIRIFRLNARGKPVAFDDEMKPGDDHR